MIVWGDSTLEVYNIPYMLYYTVYTSIIDTVCATSWRPILLNADRVHSGES